MARTVALGAAALAALAGCGDIVLAPRWSVGHSITPRRLEFGEVEVGRSETRNLVIFNQGHAPLVFEAVPPEPPWSWDAPELIEVPGGGTPTLPRSTRIRVHFTPGADQRGDCLGEAKLKLRGTDLEYAIPLEGTAIQVPIRCEPDSLAFGAVVAGEERTASVVCTNFTNYAVVVQVPEAQPLLEDMGGRFLVDRGQSRIEIPRHERHEFTVRFVADGEGAASAVLPIAHVRPADPSTGDPGTLEPIFPGEGLVLSGRAVPTHVVQLGGNLPEPTLDFGVVSLGGSRELTLELRNRYDRPVELQAEVVGDDDFVVVDVPERMEGLAGPELLRVRFAPGEPGARRGDVLLRVHRTDAPGDDVVDRVHLRGSGPVVECDPSSFDFGEVAVQSMAVANFACHRAGVDLPGTEDDLEVIGVEAGGLFFPHVVPLDGGAFRVAIEYRPTVPGPDLAQLAIVTCTGAGCSASRSREEVRTYLDLQGIGVVVDGPCDAAFEPPALDFARVASGGVARLGTRIVNRGPHACVVSRLDAPGAAPAFTLSGAPAASFRLAPGESRPIEVEFRPDAVPGEGARSAAAVGGVWISNPMRPRLELALSGRAGESCLRLDPPWLDFTSLPERAVPPDLACGAPDLKVRIKNECPEERTITGLAPAAGSDPAFLVPAPGTLPSFLAPGMEHEFSADFRPAVAGLLQGGIRVETEGPDGTDALLLPVQGRAADGGRWFDRFPLVKPRLDLLIVLASSPAMAGKPVAAALTSSSGIDNLVQYVGRPDLDTQVGITSSDLAPPSTASCTGGGRNGGEAGRLVPGNGGRPRLLSPNRPTFAADFTANVNEVRACPVEERAFDAATLAVTEPLVCSATDPRFPPNGLGNLGLIRDGAFLAIVFISAGDDASTAHSATDVLAVLGATKPPGLFSAWAIVGNRDDGCPFPTGGYALSGTRYMELVANLSGTATRTRSVCEPETWGLLWLEVGNRATASQSSYALDAPAAAEAGAVAVVHVSPDGRTKPVPYGPGGWTFGQEEGTIQLQPDTMLALLEQGGRIEVNYRLGCD